MARWSVILKPWELDFGRYDARFASNWEVKSACLDYVDKVKPKKTAFKGTQKGIWVYVHKGKEIYSEAYFFF